MARTGAARGRVRAVDAGMESSPPVDLISYLYPSFNVVSQMGRDGMGGAAGRVNRGARGKTPRPQAFSATRSLTGLWTGAKTGLPSFSFFAMAPMQQSAAIAMTAVTAWRAGGCR